MIAHVTGKLLQKQPNSVVVDVGGVGYELIVPLSTFYDLGEPGAEVSLRAYTYVREDALLLYGFRTEREKRLFLMLIGVSGVGPKLAITLLSGMSAGDLTRAIAGNDLVRLTAIPGVGKKTAERLVVEMRDKVVKLAGAEPDDAATDYRRATPGAMHDDLISALINFGWPKPAAEKAVTSVLKEQPDIGFEQAIRKAMGKLAR